MLIRLKTGFGLDRDYWKVLTKKNKNMVNSEIKDSVKYEIFRLVGPEYVIHFERGDWDDGRDDWGGRVLLMERGGLATGRVSYYIDEPDRVYLDGLSVDIRVRGKGLGAKVLELQEQIGRVLGVQYLCMCVRKESWMYNWYKKKGYVDYHEDDEVAYMWVRKEINKKNNEKD